jgi:hypothetical protein
MVSSHFAPDLTCDLEHCDLEFRMAASASKIVREKTMGRLEGKSVIITGAGSGIGRAA